MLGVCEDLGKKIQSKNNYVRDSHVLICITPCAPLVKSRLCQYVLWFACQSKLQSHSHENALNGYKQTEATYSLRINTFSRKQRSWVHRPLEQVGMMFQFTISGFDWTMSRIVRDDFIILSESTLLIFAE